MHEHAEHERVECRPEGLVQGELDERVWDVELGLDEAAFAGFLVELLLVAGGCGGDGLGGWGGFVGWEG